MIYVISSVVLNAIAQLALKYASQREISIKLIFINSPLYVAALLYLASILLWLKGLSEISLSKAYPYQSLGYLLIFGFSFLFLNERFSTTQIVGLATICLGISILGFAK